MANRFRHPVMRHMYELAMESYRLKLRNLFHTGGIPHTGNSFARAFWDGFNGSKGFGLGFAADAESRKTVAYAYYRAGQDVAKKEKNVQ